MRFSPIAAKIRKLSPSQKKVMLSGLSMAALFLGLWVFVYLPQQRQAMLIRSELLGVEKQIRQIESLMSGAKIIGGDAKSLKEKYHKLKGKFPRQEEDGITALSAFARRHNIEVLSFNPQSRRALLDENKQPLSLGGRPLEVISVSLELKASYKNLIGYLQALRESFPVFNSVESLRVTRDKDAPEKLNALLNVDLCLSS